MADKALCSIRDCGNAAWRKGWCSAHYQRWRRHGDPCGGRPMDGPPEGYLLSADGRCFVKDCGKTIHLRGLCGAHYKRWCKYGDPLGGSTPWGAAKAFLETAVSRATPDACLIWPYCRTPQGSAQIRIKKKPFLVARIVCENMRWPPPTPKHQAAHLCGKGHTGCVNWHHLEWKTQSENEKDKLIHGTHNRGERNWIAKLTNADAREILELTKSGSTQASIAKRFNVSQSNISRLVSGENWAWLKEES